MEVGSSTLRNLKLIVTSLRDPLILPAAEHKVQRRVLFFLANFRVSKIKLSLFCYSSMAIVRKDLDDFK